MFVRTRLRVYRILRRGSRVRVIDQRSDYKTRLIYKKVIIILKPTDDLVYDY